MTKLLTVLVFSTWLWLFYPPVVKAGVDVEVAGGSAELRLDEYMQVSVSDFRIIKLQAYMDSRGSPLSVYAEDFVGQADKLGLDWKLVAAISGVESNFGKFIPARSFNAWGWANGSYRFRSWEEGIEIVSESLKKNYYERGLLTPGQIGPVYAPPSSTWAGKVQYFINEFEKVEVPAADRLALRL